MPESIGLIERAAALLRDRAATQVEAAPILSPAEPPTHAAPPARAEPSAHGDGEGYEDGALILDPLSLAQHGIALPFEKRSRTVEEFRLIKRNLMNLGSQDAAKASQRPHRLIMVTSARAAEGKTFVSINLALAFASETDGEAMLIDTDTEHPMLPGIFGVPVGKGVVDVLAGRLELSDVLLRTSMPTLKILPSGPGGPHVPELFSGRRMSALLTNVTEHYDDRFIVIDTPPCLISSEAASIAPLVDQIVLVVEAHRTQEREIQSCLTLLSGCSNISLLLNKSDTISSDYFGPYGYYSSDR
jgi:protein-tyrosine kinase